MPTSITYVDVLGWFAEASRRDRRTMIDDAFGLLKSDEKLDFFRTVAAWVDAHEQEARA